VDVQVIIMRCALMPRACRTRLGCCTGGTITVRAAKTGIEPQTTCCLLGRVLRRLDKFAPAYHLVVHTAPNTRSKKGELAGYWKTLPDDFHWHIEILPIVESRSKSYSIKEIYFNSVMPEQAAEYLRSLDPGS